jgi:hypothetical protein
LSYAYLSKTKSFLMQENTKVEDWQNSMRERDITIPEAEKEILEHINNTGPYSHNIVTFILRAVAKTYGYGEANNLVEKFDLMSEFGIGKYWPIIDVLKGKREIEDVMNELEYRNEYGK